MKVTWKSHFFSGVVPPQLQEEIRVEQDHPKIPEFGLPHRPTGSRHIQFEIIAGTEPRAYRVEFCGGGTRRRLPFDHTTVRHLEVALPGKGALKIYYGPSIVFEGDFRDGEGLMPLALPPHANWLEFVSKADRAQVSRLYQGIPNWEIFAATAPTGLARVAIYVALGATIPEQDLQLVALGLNSGTIEDGLETCWPVLGELLDYIDVRSAQELRIAIRKAGLPNLCSTPRCSRVRT